MTPQTEFEWQRHPQAEAWLLERLDALVQAMPPVRRLDADLLLRTGSRLVDWLDHLILADGSRARGPLADLGFEPEGVAAQAGDAVWLHPGTFFPRVVLRAGSRAAAGEAVGAAVQVEAIDHFLAAHHLTAPAEGTPLSPYRRARLWAQDGLEFLAVERRGHSGFVPLAMKADYAQRALEAAGRWSARTRSALDRGAVVQAMDHTLTLARTLAADLGADAAAWIAFGCERVHWEQRNRAGQVQKARQDSLGLGWANHDHHTFRSSRDVFPQLIQILETFGFRCRERFYAGEEAGWGAQVMEQPGCRLAVFADVDLSPEEVAGDFAHRPLAERERLGTVGLWCALHGEAMLSAGLHHLAGRFDYDAVAAGLAEWGIKMMSPFSDFSYLRQAFTRGERWPVAPERLDALAEAGWITAAQRAQFAQNGALGSHLENIQRGEGFKGFNQQMISDIIRRTDPRTEGGAA